MDGEKTCENETRFCQSRVDTSSDSRKSQQSCIDLKPVKKKSFFFESVSNRSNLDERSFTLFPSLFLSEIETKQCDKTMVESNVLHSFTIFSFLLTSLTDLLYEE